MEDSTPTVCAQALMLGRRAGSCRWNPLDEATGLETRAYEQVLLLVELDLVPH